MSDQQLCFLTLAEQARLIGRREVSPVDVVQSVLRQIERVNGRVNAYITLLADAALASAREAELEIVAGKYRGPLHGIPIAVKDALWTRGVRTTCGSKIMRDFVPSEDATVVARLREAGAAIVGKASLHEFAYGAIGINPHYGDIHNPWDLERIPGGSSSGSAAAVATSMCSAAIGGDTGGSIRVPAAMCGVVGLKPTYGRISRYGGFPLAWSLDTVGPLCKTAEDAALVLSATAGWDSKDPASSRQPVPDYLAELHRGASGLKVAVVKEYVSDPADPEVIAAFHSSMEVLRELGVVVEELSIPAAGYAVGATTAIISAEVSSYHEEHLRTRPGDYGRDVLDRLHLGLMVAATDYVKAQRVRALAIEELRAILARYDALVCPTAPTTAPRLDQQTVEFQGLTETRQQAVVRYNRLCNLTGFPAISIPCGFASNGMPIGLQIAGAPFAEGMVLRIARAYEQGTEWHTKAPPVARE